MAVCQVSGVQIAGLACAVPERELGLAETAEQFGAEEAQKIAESTGVRSRPVAAPELCTSDLCLAAAERLLHQMQWERDSIEALIFVSQTSDYVLPASACSLQDRLKLSTNCMAFDVNLGCSGYVYGLSIASHFVTSGNIKRALLLVGDTISHLVSPEDRSAAPLFGDAGTATLLEHNVDSPSMTFNLGTDGAGTPNLIVPAGMNRHPRSETTLLRTVREGGNVRSDEELFMDGAQVFSFTLSRVPKLVRSALSAANWTMDDVDAVVMHQANAFMLRHLAKRLKLPEEKFVLAMEHFGNTSSASIPLAINSVLADKVRERPLRLLLVGFGVGWSWGAVTLTCGPMIVPEIVKVSLPKHSQPTSPAS